MLPITSPFLTNRYAPQLLIIGQEDRKKNRSEKEIERENKGTWW